MNNSDRHKKPKRFLVPILNTEYSVCVLIGSRDWANKYICSYFGEKKEFINGDNRGVSVYRKNFHPCIWIDGWLRTSRKDLDATLAHEAVHAVSEIMNYLSMDTNDISGNELLAHSVAAIIREVR